MSLPSPACVDGLIKFPTEDGPEYWACHGCGSCRPDQPQPVEDRPRPPATRTCWHGATPRCPYCAAIVIADDGPDPDDRYLDEEGPR